MIEEGPLLVGPQHFLAVTLDGLLPPAAVPNDVPVTMRMVEYIVGGAASLDAALMKDCYLWQVNPARLATFFQEADAAGISWDKVAATSLQAAVEELRARFRSLELSYDQRVVKPVDVTAPPPVVGYMGHITGSALVGSDSDPEVLFQMKALMTGHYNAAGCTSPQSVDLRATLIASVGRDITHLPLAAQGALVVGMVRRTRQPKAYTIYPGDYGACLVEATRRAGATQSELFAPLFEASWRIACPALSAAFYHPCNGVEALSWTAGLAPCVGVTGITDVTADSINSWVASILHVLDTVQLRTAGNAQRQRELLQQGSYGGAAAAASSPARRSAMEISDTADTGAMGIGKWATVATRASYKALVTTMEPLLKIPISADDNIRLAQLLASHVEPAGRFFLLGGKMGDHEPWKHCAGAAAVLQEAFELVLSTLVSASTSNVVPGKLLADGVGKKLLAGSIALTEMDYWALVKQSVSQMNGAHILLLPAHADPASSAEFFTSPALMELAEPHLTAMFAQAGWTGRDSSSFLAFLRGSSKRAKQIAALPDGLPTKQGLFKEFQEAVAAVLNAAALRRKNTIKTLLADVVGDASFVPAGSVGEQAIIQLDADVTMVLADLRLSQYGRSVGANASSDGSIVGLASLAPSSGSGSDAASRLSSRLSALESAVSEHAMRTQARRAWGSGDAWPPPHAHGRPDDVAPDWGDRAWAHGVWRAGPHDMVFGPVMVTCAEADTADITCAAAWGPNTTAQKRSRWCCNPSDCESHDAHARPGGLEEAKFVSSRVLPSSDMSGWEEIVAAAHPVGGAQSWAGGGDDWGNWSPTDNPAVSHGFDTRAAYEQWLAERTKSWQTPTPTQTDNGGRGGKGGAGKGGKGGARKRQYGRW
jgi:hypothetical protein